MSTYPFFCVLCLLLTPLIFSCNVGSSEYTDSAENQPYKIGVAYFSHETCTFCPEPTGIEQFEYHGPPLQQEEVLDYSSYIKGFVKRAKEYGNFELLGLTSPRSPYGGSSGSWVSQEAFDKYTQAMVEDIKAYGPFDGIYLSLHGAMAVTGIPKPEAEIVRRVRSEVGDIPIIVTLDLHGNEDQELSEAADAVLVVKRYPHYDTGEQGERAARLMHRILQGEYQPVMATRKPGVITPTVMQDTKTYPSIEIMERGRIWEDHEEDVYVSVLYGFPWSDVPDVGATVMVITNNDQALADEIAEDMSSFIWKVRESFANKQYPRPEVAAAQIIEAVEQGQTPVVVGDYSDRMGDATFILRELMEKNASNFCIATLKDAPLLDSLSENNVQQGEEVSVTVGGYLAESSGEPVIINGTLEYFGAYANPKDGWEFEKIAVIRFGQNNRLIISPDLYQVTYPAIFNVLDIDQSELDIIVLKSRAHFRRGFDLVDYAGSIFIVDAPEPYFGTVHLSELDYQHIPDGLYPLNETDIQTY
ncbi:M81 family metallopeptidase [Catalinimonas alkaloidigena]|uniref:M81 family metallopeptidase n=1 Tax=Catalinimonas alkaloidigena TaxID=1075417 RepID=UPI0024066D73|nr:M81 family metallopeptidase [Catalinimonas alkaloidigena]